jgi:ribosome biogenesis protein BMS1
LNSTEQGKAKYFSIAATGVVIEVDRSFQVVKKLKLVGHPQKVFKKTAFVKDMFHSDLEVSKFEGAKLRTVSGIRGAIKKAQGSDGVFRATFEDKILRSDIVFCNTWVGVEPKRLYNPVCNHLVERCVQTEGRDEDEQQQQQQQQEQKWIGMRTTGQLRHAKSINVPVNADSFYRDIERKPRVFNPLRIPKSLQAALPFSSKPKIASKGTTAMKRKSKKKKSTLSKLRRAIVMNKEEKKSHVAMQQMRTISRATQKKRDDIRKKKRGEYLKRKAREDAGRLASTKAKKKRKYKMDGLMKLQRDRASGK